MHRTATATIVLLLAWMGVASNARALDIVVSRPPHLAQGLHFPPAWYGVWEITEESKDCVTEEVLDSFTSSDSICAYSTIDFDADVEGFGECTGSADDTSIEVQCSGSFEFLPGCTATVTVSFQVTRTGESFTGREMVTITLDGDCQGAEGICELWDLSGTRTSGAESCPGVAARPESWSRLKRLYR